MKKKNIFQLFLSGVICLLCTTSCSVEPDFIRRWFRRLFIAHKMPYGNVSTGRLLTGAGTSLTTVRVGCCRNWGRTSSVCLRVVATGMTGRLSEFHHHEYTEDMTRVETGWTNFAMGVALAWDALEDLENVDFDALGLKRVRANPC